MGLVQLFGSSATAAGMVGLQNHGSARWRWRAMCSAKFKRDIPFMPTTPLPEPIVSVYG